MTFGDSGSSKSSSGGSSGGGGHSGSGSGSGSGGHHGKANVYVYVPHKANVYVPPASLFPASMAFVPTPPPRPQPKKCGAFHALCSAGGKVAHAAADGWHYTKDHAGEIATGLSIASAVVGICPLAWCMGISAGLGVMPAGMYALGGDKRAAAVQLGVTAAVLVPGAAANRLAGRGGVDLIARGSESLKVAESVRPAAISRVAAVGESVVSRQGPTQLAAKAFGMEVEAAEAWSTYLGGEDLRHRLE